MLRVIFKSKIVKSLIFSLNFWYQLITVIIKISISVFFVLLNTANLSHVICYLCPVPSENVCVINPPFFNYRLVHDRDLQLYDGKRLISNERYNFLIEKVGLTKEHLLEKGIFPIHPDFSITAVGEPPNVHSKEGNWMTPEMLSLFVFHDLRTLSKIEEMHVITSKVNSL